MYPSRPAPLPPVSIDRLPATHPFATYHVPSPCSYGPSSASSSTASLTDDQAAYPHPQSYSEPRGCPSSPFSSFSTWTNDSALHNLRPTKSPTSILAEPLTPERQCRKAVGIYRTHTNAYHSRYPCTLDVTPASMVSSNIGMLDKRPRETLLGDLEYILGKHLSFPVISRLTRRKKSKRACDPKEKGEIQRVIEQERLPEKRVLRKERNHGWEDDFAWEGVRLLDPPSPFHPACPRKQYRGVQQGNWI